MRNLMCAWLARLGPRRRRGAAGRRPPPAGGRAAAIALFHAVEVQNVVDQAHQPVAVADGHLHHLARFSGRLSSEPEEMSPSEARSEVSGVRSSWPTVEMNSSFMRSRRRRSEMSWKATTMPEMRPSSSSGLAL
jgi:hypothetical protein